MNCGLDSTELGNMVCRSIAKRAVKSKPTDAWDRGYYQGQLCIVELYMTPDDEHLNKVKAAVDAIPKRKE
jgi:hypothetical protein